MFMPTWHIQHMTPLEEFMRRTNMTDTEMAGKLGVSQPYVGRLRSGERRPSLNLAVRLEAVTAIPAAEFARPTGEAV
jgi:transcriptional regulator with XRE-family HTH domain